MPLQMFIQNLRKTKKKYSSLSFLQWNSVVGFRDVGLKMKCNEKKRKEKRREKRREEKRREEKRREEKRRETK